MILSLLLLELREVGLGVILEVVVRSEEVPGFEGEDLGMSVVKSREFVAELALSYEEELLARGEWDTLAVC